MSLSEFQSRFLQLSQRDEVAIAQFRVARFTEEINIEQFGEELFSVVDHYGFRKVVLDLSEVVFLTSSALGKVITLHRRLHRSGGHLVLCCLNPDVSEVMQTSRLIDYFNVAPDLESAVVLVNEA